MKHSEEGATGIALKSYLPYIETRKCSEEGTNDIALKSYLPYIGAGEFPEKDVT